MHWEGKYDWTSHKEIAEKLDKNTKEELGDVMLHLVFQAQISNEKGSYSISDVLENINTKLIGVMEIQFN